MKAFGGASLDSENAHIYADGFATKLMNLVNNILNADEIEWLERIREKYQMTTEAQLQIEEELYEAREALRQELISKDYAVIEHKKRMGELTLEQELELLAAIQAAREMNADELLEIAEKLYAQEQSIRDRDAQSITSLMNSVTKALSERYKEMRDEETELLKASKDSWQAWADDNVAAIQEQMDALLAGVTNWCVRLISRERYGIIC